MEGKIRLAKQLIEHYLSHPVGLPAIAEEMNISYHTLRKWFLRSEGMSMITYYQIKRFETAKKMLEDPECAIFQVTHAVGFSAASNFTRWFKHHAGITPSNYRSQRL